MDERLLKSGQLRPWGGWAEKSEHFMQPPDSPRISARLNPGTASIPTPALSTMISMWLSREAPMEVRSFAENLLSGLPVPQPSLALVTAAAALQPVSGRSMWHAWVAKDAPEAASTEISNWLMGIGHYHSPALVISSRLHPECSFTPTSSSTTTAQWSPAVSPSKYSTVDLRPLSQGGLLPTETPRIVRGRAADDKHWLDSARPNGINRPQNQPGQEHRGLSGLILEPQELDRLNSLQQWVEESSASVSIKGSVLDWMEGHNHHGQPQQQPCAWDEPCQERKPSKLESVANSQSRRMQAEHEAEEENSAAGCSGLGEVVGCPLVHVGSYIPTGVETEVVRALLGSGESEPRFVGIWGVSCSGKSQAAAAAVATPATRRAFFGGVVWVDMEVLDSSSHADEGTAVCRLLAERVARLPGCRPCWPPTHLIKSPDTGAAELRAWMGVRIANLPGPVLLVLDGISSPVQLQGLCALGASVLLLATSRAALTSLASPRPDPKYLRPLPRTRAILSCTAEVEIGPMAQREAMILLLVASGCQLDDNAHDAALGVLSASGQLPLEMILLGSMAKLRPGKRGRSCRSVDLEYLGHQLREKPAEGALSCLVRTFWMAVRELHPQDETMYLRLGACTGDLHFSLPLLKAMWGHGAHGTMSTEEVVALVGHLEQRHLLKRKGDVLGDAWQIPAVLHHHLAAELQNDAHAWSTAERRYLAYMRQCAVILVATDHSQRLLIEPFATDRSFEFMASSLQAENRPSSEMNFHCMADTTMPEKYYTACFPIADVKHVSGADQTPVSHNPIYHQDPDAWQPPAPTQRTSLKPEPFPCLEKDIARHSSMQLIPDRDSDDDSIPKPEPPGEAVPIRVPTRDAGVQSRQRTETSDIGALHDILAGLALQCDLEAPSAESPVSLQDEATLAVAAADAITVTVADAGTGMPRSALRQPLNPSTPLNSSLKKLASLTVPAAQISQLDMSIESRGAPSMASAQTCTSVDNSGAATYSDRGELLSIMEESLRTQLGEGAVANLPPPPEAISAEGEVLHYHYHYHPSLSSSLSGSPEARSPRGMSPAATMVSAPSPLFRTSGIELVAPGEFDLASEIPTTASHKLRGTDEQEHQPQTKAASPGSTLLNQGRNESAGGKTDSSKSATQGVLRVHISPSLPTSAEPDLEHQSKHQRKLSETARAEVFDYLNSALITPLDLPNPNWGA